MDIAIIVAGVLIVIIIGVTIGVVVWDMNKGNSCSSDDDCPNGMSCDLSNMVCKISTGGKCTEDSNCLPNNICSADRICVNDNPPIAMIGDPCTTGADCASGVELQCDTTRGICLVEIGGMCNATSDCISNNECINDICGLITGNECVIDEDCLETEICDEGICVLLPLSGFDEFCTTTIDCETGLECDTSQELCKIEELGTCMVQSDCTNTAECIRNRCITLL